MAAKNLIDSVVGFFSPSAGLQRARARTAYEYISKSRSYEGASRGRRTEGWITTGASPQASTSRSIVQLRNRARDLVRNNPFASRATQVFVSNVIGYGIRSQLKNGSSDRKFSRLEDAWKEWSDSTQCDADSRKDLYGIQALTMRAIVESGEALVVRRRLPSEKQTIAMQLQLLEPDYIDSDRTDADTFQGIKFDKSGNRVGYWLFKEHPGNIEHRSFFTKAALQSELVDVKDVLHIFREDRAGQIRGVTWFAPSMIAMRELDEYMDASIVKQKVAASFSAFIQDIDANADLAADSEQRPISEHLEPGIIEILPPGKTISFPSPPSVNEFDPFTRAMLRQIASGLGIAYEALTSDYSQVNFSSGRMGWLEFQRNLESWRWQMFIPQFCERVSEWFFEAAELRGMPRGKASFKYTPPAREMIDPNAEYTALQKAVRNGFITLPEAIRSSGNDPEEQAEEIAAFNKIIDEKGLILDSDPRRIMGASGSAQVDPNTPSAQTDSSQRNQEYFVDDKQALWKKTANGFAKLI